MDEVRTMSKIFLVDLSRCTGCYNCQLACKDEHVGNDWSPYAKPQPEVGHFWLKLNDVERGSGSFTRVSYVPTLCAHCENAPCMNVCPVNAIYRRNDGIVIIDPEKCNGCEECISACPYGAIYWNEDLRIAQKCTGCAHLLDQGWKEPRCVEACPTGALKFGDDEELRDMLSRSEAVLPVITGGAIELKDMSQFKPKLRYLGADLLKPFLAGSVYDPEADEVLQGAKVTLIDKDAGSSKWVLTDEFGDFKFTSLKLHGSYIVRIEKDGYYSRTIDVPSLDKDTNLGDIELYKIPVA
jgi:Fe-S-cluster-containing dehydrogenase component